MESHFTEKIKERIMEGDENAFKHICNLYKNRLYKTAIIYLNDEKAAEDVLQEVFITIYTKIYKLKNAYAFEAWMYRILLNCCHSYLRKNKKYVISGDETFNNIIDSNKDAQPEAAILQNETYEQLSRSINKLSEQLKVTILLFYFNNMTVTEIAEVLQCSEGTVKSRLFKARKALEKDLSTENEKEVNAYGYR